MICTISQENVFRDNTTVPHRLLKKSYTYNYAVPTFTLNYIFSFSSYLSYDNLKKRAKSEIEVAMFAPQAILSEIQERNQLKEKSHHADRGGHQPARKMHGKVSRFGPLNNSFVQQLVRAMEFLLLFRGKNDLPLKRLA